MKQVALSDFETYFESGLDTLSSVTTVGALNSGSITSGFGTIDTGSSTITTTGVVTAGGFTIGSAVINEADLEQIDDLTAGTVTASKAVVVDSNKDAASFRNITLTGELDAGSLDVSGNADIDGTLEADAYTVDGTALNEYIADTVGAMVESNTETGIAVTYQDGDNTLDFAIGTLNQNTTGNAATATALETGRTINGTSFDGTANITVSVDSSEITSGAVDLAHMSSESVDEDNLYISNSGSDGQYLQKQSGDNGGLTWAAVSGGEGVIAETENTISTSYTITSGYNASSAGPVVIASGATVTISSGSVWVII
jgi:hypothetical protein